MGKSKSKSTILLDKISFYLDPIFALTLVALAGIRIWQGLYTSAEQIVFLSYYIFFALILILTLFAKKVMYKYLGFLDGDFFKALFYVFLATLVFADWSYWVNFIVGSCMAIASIFNLFRFFTRKCKGEDLDKAPEKQVDQQADRLILNWP
eukprot:403347094